MFFKNKFKCVKVILIIFIINNKRYKLIVFLCYNMTVLYAKYPKHKEKYLLSNISILFLTINFN